MHCGTFEQKIGINYLQAYLRAGSHIMYMLMLIVDVSKSKFLVGANKQLGSPL